MEECIRNLFIQEIFGKHERMVNYYGLANYDSEEELKTKLDDLKGGEPVV